MTTPNLPRPAARASLVPRQTTCFKGGDNVLSGKQFASVMPSREKSSFLREADQAARTLTPLYHPLRPVAKDFSQKYGQQPSWALVAVMRWAALHDRPVSWVGRCRRDRSRLLERRADRAYIHAQRAA